MKSFRVIITLIAIGVLGVVSLIMGIKDSAIMASPAVDLTHIDEDGFNKLKKNTHVKIDVGPVWGQPIQETTTNKTYGITTSSYESARYYEVPIFYQNSAGEICWDHSIIVRVNKDNFALMDQQMSLTEEWNNDEDATYEMLPAKVKTLEGKFVAFDKEELDILRRYLGEGQNISDMEVKSYFTPCYLTTTRGNPVILIVFGIAMIAVGVIPLVIVLAGKKSEQAYMTNIRPSSVTDNTDSTPFNAGNPAAGSVSLGSSSEPDPNGELDFLKPKIGESAPSAPVAAPAAASYAAAQSVDPISYNGSATAPAAESSYSYSAQPTQTATGSSYSYSTQPSQAAASSYSYNAQPSPSAASSYSYSASPVAAQPSPAAESSYSYSAQPTQPAATSSYSYSAQPTTPAAAPVSYSASSVASQPSQTGAGSSYSYSAQPSQTAAGSSYSFNSQPSQTGMGSSYSDNSSSLSQDLTNSGYSYNTQPTSDSSSGVLGHPSNANAGGLFGAPTHAYDKPAVVESPDEPHIRKSQGFSFGAVGTSQPSYGGVQVAATGGGVFGNGSSETGRVQVAANGGISMSDEMMGGSTGGSTDGFN